MTPANYGSVFSSCLFGSLMMLYLFVFCRSNRFILRNGTSVIYLAVGVVMIRMLLPWNFHFAMNVESHKILPFLCFISVTVYPVPQNRATAKKLFS